MVCVAMRCAVRLCVCCVVFCVGCACVCHVLPGVCVMHCDARCSYVMVGSVCVIRICCVVMCEAL